MTSDLTSRLMRALAHLGGASSDFDLNPDVELPANRILTPASVLIAVDPVDESVILTMRSPRLKHHPGQIAFPGGKKDTSDQDLIATALRESQEEIGLPIDAVNVLGSLPSHETVTGFQVTPYVGVLSRAFHPLPEEGEVSEVFRVPLAHVTARENFRAEGRRWQGRKRYYYVVPYGPYYIWGATARMLHSLAERMS